MVTINLIPEIPKRIQRTIFAVGKIHYQPNSGGLHEDLEVDGWLQIKEEIKPKDEPKIIQA